MMTLIRSFTLLLSTSVALVACGGAEPAAQTPTSAAAGGGQPVANADTVIATMKPDFRKCYDAALQKDPKAAGQVVVVANVGPGGEVKSATAQDATLPAEASDCIVKRVQAAKFDPPGPNGSTLKIPVKFEGGK